MSWYLFFILNSVLFGVGLAMDAFSVSLANGLNEPDMKRKKAAMVAATFALFQILMPLLGWLFVHTLASIFLSFQKWIPWIAWLLLLYIGGKMLKEGIQEKGDAAAKTAVGMGELLLQGIATSIDALSVGFTIAAYRFPTAFAESLIIGIVTFFICVLGLRLGKKAGTRLSGKASILGGCILIAIGFEILLRGIMGS